MGMQEEVQERRYTMMENKPCENDSLDKWEKENRVTTETIEDFLDDLEKHPEKKKYLSELSRKAAAEAMKDSIGREMKYRQVRREMARRIGK